MLIQTAAYARYDRGECSLGAPRTGSCLSATAGLRGAVCAITYEAPRLGCRARARPVESRAQLLNSWERLGVPGQLVATALVLGAIATAKSTLAASWVPWPARALAGVAAVLSVAMLVAYVRHSAVRLATAVTSFAAVVAGIALAPILAQQPPAVAALWASLLLPSLLVGAATTLWTAGGMALGVGLAQMVSPGPAATRDLMLAVDHSYHGLAVSPIWLSSDHALIVAAAALFADGLVTFIAARRQALPNGASRDEALVRLIDGNGEMSPMRSAAVIRALADPAWRITGLAVVEGSTVRVITARTPGGSPSWRAFVGALRDAVVPLAHPRNPLARAALLAERMDVASCGELTDGMWRLFNEEQRVAARSPARGYAIPYGDADRRGVLFAMTDTDKPPVGNWLSDLAGALTLLDGLRRPALRGARR